MKTIRTRWDLAWLLAQADRQQVYTTQSVLLVGPPGSCKTMVARRMAARVPRPEGYDEVGVAWIQYGARLRGPDDGAPEKAPFRAPHHTCSAAALCGGGVPLRPGEASLAHRGTLFLDELPEFRRSTIRDLGAALQRGQVELARARQRATIPAAPKLLVASAAPCPCGYHGTSRCRCSATAIEAHMARVRDFAEKLGIAVYVRLDLDTEAQQALAEYPT